MGAYKKTLQMGTIHNLIRTVTHTNTSQIYDHISKSN